MRNLKYLPHWQINFADLQKLSAKDVREGLPSAGDHFSHAKKLFIAEARRRRILTLKMM